MNDLIEQLGINWKLLLSLAINENVMPLLFRTITMNCPSAVPQEWMTQLRNCYKENAIRNFRMTKEPENMLIQHRITAASRIEEAGIEEFIGQQHGHRTGKHRHDGDQQECSNQPSPNEQRHFHQCHAGRAHIEDSGDNVDSAHD